MPTQKNRISKRDNMKLLVKEWASCEACRIGVICKHHVFYRGDPTANLVIIGEGPGQAEDEFGEPFVGKAGKLLDDLLRDAGLDSESDVFITNTVCCLPRDDTHEDSRIPTKREIENCSIRLVQMLKIVDPLAVVLLGRVAHEGFEPYLGCKSRIWYAKHPSYLLHNNKGKNSKDYQGLLDAFIEAKDYSYA